MRARNTAREKYKFLNMCECVCECVRARNTAHEKYNFLLAASTSVW